ncbi:MAG TPA: NAD(P)H-binding protein [Thermoanaerobaculia bacterium]|nr:NAD(P)H-binding protein [Thermoanaerobaculia bacterium]
MRRVAVIGATGTIGRAVTSELARGGDCDVVAVSRTVRAASIPPGVRAVQADLTMPSSLDAALRDVDAVFLVWTASPAAAPAAIERIARHVNRLVFLSAPHKTPHPFFQQPNPMAAMMKQIEASIEASTLEWTILRPTMFASNAIAWWAPQIQRDDVVRWPYAAAATAPIDERDIAAVAARVLHDDRHGGRDYVLSGPQSLTQAEQVASIGDAIGRRILFEEIPPNESGLPDMLLDAWSAAAGIPALVTTAVADLTGKQPRSFRQWAADHAGAFR